MNNKHLCSLVLSYQIALLIFPSSSSAQSVSQTGNVVQIISKDHGNFILIADAGFSELANYEFVIELPKSSDKNKSTPSAENKKEENKAAQILDLTSALILANQLYKERKYTEALSLIEKILNAFPNSSRALAMRGSLKSVLNNKEGAIKDWQQAARLEVSESKLKQQLNTQLPGIK